jgi:hypothetical protein
MQHFRKNLRQCVVQRQTRVKEQFFTELQLRFETRVEEVLREFLMFRYIFFEPIIIYSVKRHFLA